MWKTFISNVSTDFQFKVPATKDEISQIKEKLNVELPNDLSSLLNETNGVFDEYDCLFIW
ncbi:SMI1/KNR4 family protein, partial [Bacillus cereus group sp. Bce021]